MKKILALAVFILLGTSLSYAQHSTIFVETPRPDGWQRTQDGLRDLRESAVQRQQLELQRQQIELQRQQIQAIQEPQRAETTTALPMISANGFDCEFTEETKDAIFCSGSFQRMNPQVTVGGLSPKLITLMANGIDTETGKRSAFLYESLTGCVSIVTDNGKTTIDRQGKAHKLKKNQKVKGCLN